MVMEAEKPHNVPSVSSKPVAERSPSLKTSEPWIRQFPVRGGGPEKGEGEGRGRGRLVRVQRLKTGTPVSAAGVDGISAPKERTFAISPPLGSLWADFG